MELCPAGRHVPFYGITYVFGHEDGAEMAQRQTRETQ